MVDVVDPQEEFLRNKFRMVAFNHLPVKQGVVDDAAVERLFKDFDQLLLVHLHALGFPLKGQPDQLALLVDHDLPYAVGLYDVVALGHFRDPFAFFEFLPHTGHGPLLSQLVVKLGKQKLDVLVQHTAGVGGVGGLGNGKNGHAVLLAKVLRQLDGPAARAGKAVKRIDQDVRDLAAILFYKLQHPQELLPTVRFGRLVGAAEVAHTWWRLRFLN